MTTKLQSCTNKVLLVFVLGGVAASCARGRLYEPGDENAEDFPVVVQTDDIPTNFSLLPLSTSSSELYFGKRDDFYELTYFEPEASGSSTTSSSEGEEPGSIVRYLFRQPTDLDLQKEILIPQNDFNPMRNASCYVKVIGKPSGSFSCDGLFTCKRFDNLQVFANGDGDLCDFPRFSNFLVRTDDNGLSIEVPDLSPNSRETWLGLNRITIPKVRSVGIRTAKKARTFTKVVGSQTAKGFMVAGKYSSLPDISAASFDLGKILADDYQPTYSVDSDQQFDMLDSNGDGIWEQASTKNILLEITKDGVFTLSGEQNWRKLALPEGLATVPARSDLRNLSAVSGEHKALFILGVKDGARDKDVVIGFSEADQKLFLVDMTNFSAGESLGAWELHIVNNEIWAWNPALPAKPFQYDAEDKSWKEISLVLPNADGISPNYYQFSEAGDGFVLSFSYQKEFRDIAGLEPDVVVSKPIYRHTYYSANHEKLGESLDTFNPPEGLHFSQNQMFVERVLGLGATATLVPFEYGYIYDFSQGKGYMFSDTYRAIGDSDSILDNILAYNAVMIPFAEGRLVLGGCLTLSNGRCDKALTTARYVPLDPKLFE